MSRGASRALVVASSTILLTAAPARAAEPVTEALVVVVRGVSFGDAIKVPRLRELASQRPASGAPSGAALLVPQEPLDEQLDRLIASPEGDQVVVVGHDGPVGAIGATIDRATDGSQAEFVVVVGAAPSPAMIERKDAVLPLIVGLSGSRSGSGNPRALTSDSTRRVGVVSSVDLVPTIQEALMVAPSRPGSPVEETDDEAPVRLYERYLQMRRLSVPVQAAAWIGVLMAGLLLAALMFLRARRPDRIPDPVADRFRWLGLAVVPLVVGMYAAGHLSTLTYATVVPFLVVVTTIGTAALMPFARRGTFAPIAALGGGVLALALVEAALGWGAALTPLIGGSQLDGGRFFGMPNVLIGVVIGAAAYVSTRLSIRLGTTAFAGAILLMGLPWTGANIGAAVAGSTALGLWVVLRLRGRLDLRGVAVVAGVTIAGTALLLAIHRFVPGAPTHGTRFVQGGLGDPLAVITDRLEVGFALLLASPAAWIPAVGPVVLAVLAVRPTRSIAPALRAEPLLHCLVLTLALTGIVAYVVEDSGAGASGMFFALGLGALFYVSLPLASSQDRASP